MEIDKSQLLEIFNSLGVYMSEEQLAQKMDEWRGVDKNFLEIFLKYNHVEMEDSVIDRLLPLPLYASVIKCPMLIKHYKDKQKAYFPGNSERDTIVKLLNDQKYKHITDDDLQLLIDGSKLNVTARALNKVFDYVEMLLNKESDTDHTARMLVDRIYSINDEEGKPVMGFKNLLSVVGKDSYHIYYIKVTDDDYNETYLKYFAENMFLTALAGLTKVSDKNVKVNLLLVRPNDMLVPIRWHIPKGFLANNGTNAAEMVKKYIYTHFNTLPEDMTDMEKLIKQTQTQKIKFCPNCGYRHLKPGIFGEPKKRGR